MWVPPVDRCTTYANEPPELDLCQGDLIELTTDLPYISQDGTAELLEFSPHHTWLVLSNTCDLQRTLKDVTYAQLVPLIELNPSLRPELLPALRRYAYSRRFYLPDWQPQRQLHFFAEFTMPVTVHRKALLSSGKRLASLSRVSWILLHACLVRFLARDDDRFAA